jgi:hypothetical protein
LVPVSHLKAGVDGRLRGHDEGGWCGSCVLDGLELIFCHLKFDSSSGSPKAWAVPQHLPGLNHSREAVFKDSDLGPFGRREGFHARVEICARLRKRTNKRKNGAIRSLDEPQPRYKTHANDLVKFLAEKLDVWWFHILDVLREFEAAYLIDQN